MTKKQKRIEYVGSVKFAAQKYDLKSLPTNERAAQDAAAIMPLMRMAAVFINDSDKGMEKKIREGGDLGPWLDLLEQLVDAAQHKKQDYDLLNAGSMRLQVVLERIVGKKEMKQTYAGKAA